jgi:5-methylcytosine-specific restriction endonuclease McrA
MKAWSGGLCKNHIPRKGLKNLTSLVKKQTSIRQTSEIRDFFLQIWKKRPHKCENCNKSLGNEPLSYMFDHLLEKSKYPDLTFEEDNIMIVCLECHDNKTRGFLSDLVKEKIKTISEKFGK